jgi:hypothetical protein
MNEQKTEISFAVTIQYSYETGTPFCTESAQHNLTEAIENERMNGALTPYDISASQAKVNPIIHEPNKMSVLDLDMSEVIGEYDTPDGIVEWEWVEKNASFSHKHNNSDGIWEFMVNTDNELTGIPKRLYPFFERARNSGHSYILFNQGT